LTIPISITKTLLIVPTKNERDPPLFTGKLLIKFQNIFRNTTQVIIRHRVKILFSVIDMTENRIFTLCRMITWVVFLRMFWNFITSLPVKRGGSLSFLTIFTFAVPLRNTTQVIIWHSIKIIFSVISSPITLERQKCKSSKMKGIL
jgi:hypothetical protein